MNDMNKIMKIIGRATSSMEGSEISPNTKIHHNA